MIKRERILVTGRVQGVGFRPGVYHAAVKLALDGFVFNDTKGVTIEVQGAAEAIGGFLRWLQKEGGPPAAKMKSCTCVEIPIVEGESGFVIRTSCAEGTRLSEVTADMAICCDCAAEMKEKKDFRYRYPFINCTNCGPRYSIVKTIPYDRCNTTMSVFPMCDKCGGQYVDVADRRFHAQPVACGECGPKMWLTDGKGEVVCDDTYDSIVKAAQMLADGKVVAIKGIGGFHLAVDAINNEAVRRLRQRKRRDHKPFAMMADSIEKIKEYAEVTEAAERILRGVESPVVLLKKKANCGIAENVAEGVSTYGFMLVYAPVHFLVFDKCGEMGVDILVMTSGNISDEPLICDNDEAIKRLGDVADGFLMHDREIFRQIDDSIVHIVDDAPVLLRRARGYVPTPIIIENSCPKDIFAAGSDLKNTFCFVKQNQLIASEHIGDLEDAEVYHHYIRSIEHLRDLFEVSPEIVVCDLHPGYLSSQFARSISGVEVMEVQHHWAHIASVLAENNISGPVIGLTADGTGYGSDGAVWGCECLIASLDDFERFGHLGYYPLAGGDKASKEAIRSVVGLLKKTFGDDFKQEECDWLLERIEPDGEKRKIVCEQVERRINTVDTSSLGRVFDAVAAMVGLGGYNNFEAQLPMALESIAVVGIKETYNFEIKAAPPGPLQLDLSKMFRELICDVKQGVGAGIISAKFHNCIAAGLLEMAERAREKTDLVTVALSGGVFCNRYLTNLLIRDLNKKGFRVLFNKEIPSNDGCISVGQAAIAARRITKT